MDFEVFKLLLQQNFLQQTRNINHLFITDTDPDELWNLYLDSFPRGTNEVFRERREFDCSCCRSFIKTFGSVIWINEDYLPETIWDFLITDDRFQIVSEVMAEYVKSRPIKDVFLSKERNIGTDKTPELLDDGKVITWHHFYLQLPPKFIYSGSDTLSTVRGNYRASKEVFGRSLKEITLDATDTVLELVESNSLYRGSENTRVLKKFRSLQKKYKLLDTDKTDCFCWLEALKSGAYISRIRNYAIGTLLINVSDNMSLDKAVGKYEAIVAPVNYKRPKAKESYRAWFI